MALDKNGSQIMSYAYDPHSLRSVPVCKDAVAACSPLTLTTGLCDACIYVLNKSVVEVRTDCVGIIHLAIVITTELSEHGQFLFDTPFCT